MIQDFSTDPNTLRERYAVRFQACDANVFITDAEQVLTIAEVALSAARVACSRSVQRALTEVDAQEFTCGLQASWTEDEVGFTCSYAKCLGAVAAADRPSHIAVISVIEGVKTLKNEDLQHRQ